MNKHVVIIGSGLGGLTTGYILSKNGYKVTILEQNAQFGGCLQTFTRGGVVFETGMHYIGSMDEGQALYNFFNYLSLLPDVKLYSLDRTAYDIISVAGQRFSFANGDENFVDTLSQHFPAERQNLLRYRQAIRDVAGNSPLYSFRQSNSMTLIDPNYIKKSASEFIAATTNNQLLQQVLAGNLPLYAGIENRTPIYIHALINDFYNKSAYRIIGGSDVIAKSLVQSIRSMGGTILSLSKVVKINCDTTKAVSVTLENGDNIQGDYFISNIHPVRTVELMDTNLIRKSYRNRIGSLKNTVSNFTVYLKFRKNTVPYFNSNLFHFNEDKVWGCEQYTETSWPKSFLYMHLCSSVNQQYVDAAVLIAYMNFDDVSHWLGTSIGRRGESYEAFKQQKAERLLDELEKQMPGTRKNIESYYTSTPLTYLDYTGTEEGSMYGISRDCSEPIQSVVSQRTKIPNLFQTGQNINSHGILGVIIGSIITAGEFLGVNTIIDQIKRTIA